MSIEGKVLMVPLTFAVVVGMQSGSQWIWWSTLLLVLVNIDQVIALLVCTHLMIAVTHQSLFTVQLVIALLVVRLLNQTVHSRWHPKYSTTWNLKEDHSVAYCTRKEIVLLFTLWRIRGLSLLLYAGLEEYRCLNNQDCLQWFLLV